MLTPPAGDPTCVGIATASGMVSFLAFFVGAGTTVLVDSVELDKFATEEMSSSELGAEYPVV